MAKNNLAEQLLLKVKDPRIILWRIQDAASFNSFNRSRVVADFFGQVSGRPLLVECKETEGTSIPYSKLRREASSHQLDALSRWRMCHDTALAGYFCRLGDALVYVPVDYISDGPGSITADHQGARVQLITEPIRLHFLLTGIE